MASFVLGLLFVVEIAVALLMVAVVMLQPPKDPSGGMNAVAGGSFGEEVFGGRTGNVLSRTTVILGIILIFNSLAIAAMMRGNQQKESLINQGVAPVESVPAPVESVPAPAAE